MLIAALFSVSGLIKAWLEVKRWLVDVILDIINNCHQVQQSEV